MNPTKITLTFEDGTESIMWQKAIETPAAEVAPETVAEVPAETPAADATPAA